MAIKNQVLTVQYTAWDTTNNIGKTGDVANHTLKVITDGVAATPAASPAEVDATNCPGVYKITLSASEMNGNSISLAGKSSTANIIIIPIHITTERGLVDAAITTRSSHSAADVKTAVEADGSKLDAVYDKLPTNYIMGSAVQTDKDDDIDAIVGYVDKIDDATDGLTAIKAEVEGLAGAAMRGTDNAALASVCTETRLAELDAANLPANVDTLLSRISSAVATALTKIADAAIAGTETAGSLLRLFYDRVTGAVALDSTVAKQATLDNVTYGLSALKTLIDAIDTSTELQARFTEIKGAGWTTETLKAIKEYVDTLAADIAALLVSNISSGGVLASTITIVEGSPITVKRGDIKRLTFSFGSAWNLTGKKLYFCAKLNKADSNSTAIVNREVDLITDIANAGGYIDLTVVETAKTGIYEAEFERRNTDGTSPETIWEGALIIEQDTRQ